HRPSRQRHGLYPELFYAVVATQPAYPRRNRHSAGEEDADALLDRDVRERRLIALANDDVAKVQVIGRHIYREHRFGAAPAIDGELARQESKQKPAFGILHHYHALEPRLVVRRKGDYKLLHRGINRAEKRHTQQPALRPLQHASADDVGRKYAGQENDDRSEEHTSELQSRFDLVCRLLLEKKKGTPTRLRKAFENLSKVSVSRRNTSHSFAD